MLLELEDPSLDFSTESIRFSNYTHTRDQKALYTRTSELDFLSISYLLSEAWEVMGPECCLGSVAEGNHGDAATVSLSLPPQQLRQPLQEQG